MTRSQTSEAGFTIIEVVVATLVLTLGALATFGLLSSATKNTERAKATQVALDRAQRELEALRSLSSEELALLVTPPHSPNPLDPDYRVNATTGTFALTKEPSAKRPKLVVNGGVANGEPIAGGIVDPGPTPFTSGDVSGEVYRYIVQRDDEVCAAACPGEMDFKQVIVAVKLDTPGNQAAERSYVEVQSDFIDPTDSADNDPQPGPDDKIVTAQQFFLSDTPCAASGETERLEITASHPLHNTLGKCTDGPQTGGKEGAPDALLLGAPPDPAPADPSNPPLYDYADDLNPTPDTDKGVQILRDDTSGCHYKPIGATNPEAKVHRWVTDPFGADFVLSEKATIEFNTRALNGVTHSGEVCVYLFKRTSTGDTLLLNAETGTDHWSYEKSEWPLTWTGAKLEMSFQGAPYTIPAGSRLGVALSVERTSTSGADAIQIMYDHPDYATRIEVDTTTPIGGG
jgi:type II secretory pathway pseudopilin PulG